MAALLIQFRYRKQDWNGTATDSYYKPYEQYIGGFNWWSFANGINSYFKILIYATAFVT